MVLNMTREQLYTRGGLLDKLPGVLFWVSVWSIVALIQMGLDKRRAKAGQRRIPEATLLLTALLGGSPGSLLGMMTFHHKTQKLKFRIGIPLILLAQLALAAALWWFAP